jgi:hypothetical protein
MKKQTLILIIGLSFWSCDNPSLRELGNGYFLTQNSMNDHSIAKPTKGYSTSETYSYVIYGDIISYDFDSRFVIAAEKPRDSVSGINSLSYEEAERLFNQSNFRQFYILDKINEHLYGPFKRELFDRKRMELNVPDSLKIESNSR